MKVLVHLLSPVHDSSRHMRLIVNMHTTWLKNFYRWVKTENLFVWSKYFACRRDRYKLRGTKSCVPSSLTLLLALETAKSENSGQWKSKALAILYYFSEFEIRLCFITFQPYFILLREDERTIISLNGSQAVSLASETGSYLACWSWTDPSSQWQQ